ncbi:BREX-1 system adenine-specific DNA-methyltransferase PglX [Aeromonas allosaccharophila]|nr:BREX-1 system adenine-specific DNA-methyltransferase PglX [Aeromonas allosaccharophila]
MQQHFYRASAADFGKIPGSPIAYWMSSAQLKLFSMPKISQYGQVGVGLQTGNNSKYMRHWFELNIDYVELRSESKSNYTWYRCNKGGDYRKWYGNSVEVVLWRNNGAELKANVPSSVIRNEKLYFMPCVTWSRITSGSISFRYIPEGFIHNDASCFVVGNDQCVNMSLLAYLNSPLRKVVLENLNPTLNLLPGQVNDTPFLGSGGGGVETLIDISKSDWNSYEVSWNYSQHPLLKVSEYHSLLNAGNKELRSRWLNNTLYMQRLEEENNKIFIDTYGLQDDLTPEVPLSEITLTCNPHYRYGGNLTDEEREARLQSDTISELISYAIGCMMGRYSLDREGLVYAHAGNEGFKALVEEGAYATFAADEDGILPLSTESWFADDVATRLEAFVRTVWGKDTLEENLQFIADSLCLAAIKPVKKGGETSRETLRRYLSTQFYKDHMKTYKKRPIYWLFSSGKEKAFECLVYLHRYNEATLPRMRTEYVTPLLGQMAGRIERLRLQQTEASTSDAKRIGKEIDSLIKQLSELRAFDDQLKHHADMRITLDLDDGVKVNYGKFGTLLSDVKAITGDKGE